MKKLVFLLMILPSLAFASGPEGIQHPPLQINDNSTITYGYFYLLTVTGTNTLTNPNDGTFSITCGVAPVSNKLLLEDSSFLLLENGTDLLLEQ